ncbi:patatin-like phospholipase family protein [Hansschlegelia zhihuaiae]|uniref:Patatin-like phospholipase family protein n=1 Tax=Hansschlegelia zhihuaiae TaxID=405005 RepID=A0A4Q0MH09_9HYPH|nr:patatin-like phospholipase family protein [Hansschlegelia zhihuaiae]RXF72861.1 patatin-like phospholipase family protein [Hansschlegelia zhihuaiae]
MAPPVALQPLPLSNDQALAAPLKAKRFADGLCLSGGGYRAMLFHAGALARLNEAGLLKGIEVVSSVSGGSIAAGVLAQAWPRLEFDEKGVAQRLGEEVIEPLCKFSQAFVDGPAVLKGLATPWSTAGREVAKAYSRHLFDETRLQDLTDRPLFIFCASNLTTGSLFRMSRAYVADYRIGLARDANWLLADVVACSSAFPPFLSPIRIDLTPHTWSEEKLDGSVGPAAPPGRAVLTDGGVYDNHGVEPVMKRCRRVFVSDAGAAWRKSDSGFWTWYSQLKRVTDTIDNQVRSLRRSELIDAFKAASKAEAKGVDIAADGTFTRGCYWSIAPSPTLLSSAPALRDILATCDPKPMEVATVLHFLGERATREPSTGDTTSRIRHFAPMSTRTSLWVRDRRLHLTA